MFGFIIGAACLIGLAKVIRGPRWHHRFYGHHFSHPGAYAGGYGAPGCGGGSCETPYRGFGPGGFDRSRGWYGSEEGSEPFAGRGFGGFARGRRGPWAMIEELELTREQMKALREVREEWKDAARTAKKSAKTVKDDLAVALRAESFDESLVGASLAKFDEVTDGLKKSMLASLAKAHQVLDEKQRQKLADFIDDGAFRRGGFAL